MEKRVLLGMSGGTDSSVAAIKLQDAGYEVAGVTLRLHDDGGRAAEEAARLADRLGIEHFEYDAREAFEAQVVRTPLVQMLSLIPAGTPASGESASPDRRRPSIRSACSRAVSRVTVRYAPISPSASPMRPR